GESGDSLFIIVDGTVKVEIELPNKEKLVVARLGVGKYFGEMALLTGESRTADVIAQTDCSLFEITKDDIAPILKKRPAVAETLSQVLSDRKSDTESKKGDFQSEGKMKESFFRKIKGFFKL
ncbi:MAG: cyclic nucleotide-binding domain-containing protein, partial [Proteobacteria bacterium]|nr:cyclic nucleotide-binding domain-containing protein [Pseudomonadota bacterium]